MTDFSKFGLDPWGTVSTTTGTFTPAPEAAQAENLNPYVDAAPWGVIDVGPVRLPGVVQSIDGADKPEEWSVQKGSSSSGATTVWKGTKLAESIKIVMALHDAESFAAYYVVRDTLRPKIGKKPPSHLIVNPIINFNGLTKISVKNIAPPKWVASGGYWTGEIELVEFNPSKPANAGPASPAPSSPQGAVDVLLDANKVVQDAVAEAIRQAAKAG